MADYDKSAHDMMRFRAGKYSVFERGRFLVAYHEDHLYSVRDEKRGTVTLVEARNPESAYLKASSIRPISSADVVEVVRCKDCINWNWNNCITVYGLYAPRPDDYCSRGEKNSG